MSRRKWKRDATKESFWRKIVDGHVKSGLSIRVWCRKQGVNEPSFYSWRRELIRRDSECVGDVGDHTPNPSPTFVPIRVTDDNREASPSCIEIVLDDNRCIRVVGRVDYEALAGVLDVLERRAC